MKRSLFKGPIAWMAQNPVAANLLMLVLMGGGYLVGGTIKQEVFPEFELDAVMITVPYPGASPEEVEKGIVLALEEAVRGLDGVKKMTATAGEGNASLVVELLLGTDTNRALQDVKAAIDRIRTFPEEAERPSVRLMSNRQQVIALVLYGDVQERALRELAEQARDELVQRDEITVAELDAVRRPEIAVEVPTATLRAHGLTLGQIAQKVRTTALELPAGSLKTPSGEVLLRTKERRELAHEFADVSIVSTAQGVELRLGDLGSVTDGFEDSDEFASYNGKPAAMVRVYRVGEQTPVTVADTVYDFVESFRERLPPGVGIATWRDRSQMFRDRVDLLQRNALLGLILVLVVLGLFLEVRLAFWVTLGIPISFLGALLLLPGFDVSINMISLFAFIVVLGMVVDDAIVVGENIFEYRQQGLPLAEAAIRGAREVATPVTFAILTTVVTFSPMLMVPGFMGKLFGVIPIIVISVLLMSLIESLFVLPAHLSHEQKVPERGLLRYLMLPIVAVLAIPYSVFKVLQVPFSSGLHFVIQRLFRPVLAWCLEFRYVTIAFGLAMAITVVGLVVGGRVSFSFMPRIESDRVSASATLPYGTAVSETKKVQKRLLEAAQAVIAEHGGDELVRGMFAQVGRQPRGGGPGGSSGARGGHLASVQVYLVPLSQRTMSAAQFTQKWREKAGRIPGLESLYFKFAIGRRGGGAVDVQLSHRDTDVLERAAADLAESLRTFDGTEDIDDGFASGKPQLDFKLKAGASSLGLSVTDLARQVRHSFYGAEALRQQRGRDELRVMVRLPKSERRSMHDLDQLMIRAPGRGEIPLSEAASVTRGQAYTQIMRSDGRRVLNVTSDLRKGVPPMAIIASLRKDTLPALAAKYPGLSYTFEGDQRDQAESMGSLGRGFLFAMALVFALLAIPFRSYIQPLVILAAIPFGVIGAIVGHMLMGFNLSIISMMGMVALSGVVVNDSLVLVDAANRYRAAGRSPFDAVSAAAVRRFRPILLTSLTTFLGLAPMIFETSVQARFLVPMAISLGFGVLFATFIILVLVPAFYVAVEDVKHLLGLGLGAKVAGAATLGPDDLPAIDVIENPDVPAATVSDTQAEEPR